METKSATVDAMNIRQCLLQYAKEHTEIEFRNCKLIPGMRLSELLVDSESNSYPEFTVVWEAAEHGHTLHAWMDFWFEGLLKMKTSLTASVSVWRSLSPVKTNNEMLFEEIKAVLCQPLEVSTVADEHAARLTVDFAKAIADEIAEALDAWSSQDDTYESVSDNNS